MSITGNGTVARALVDREGFIFFASGVSNSSETREDEYKREESLLMQQDQSKHLVYFSTLSIFYANNRYAEHKRHMEKVIMTYFDRYTIVRLGNLSFGNNENHLIPFLRKKIKSNEPIDIQDVYRYPLDLDEFQYWMSMIPDWSCEMNIPGRRMKVVELIEDIKNGKI